MKKFFEKIVAGVSIVIAAISTVFSMVFYTKLQKEVERLRKERAEREAADAAKLKETEERYASEMQEQQELKSKVINHDSNRDNDYVSQLMQNTTKKGNKRNSP